MVSALTILTRSPSDPRTKTRLSARIPSDAGRRELVLAFLADLIGRGDGLPGVAVRLAVTAPVEGLRFARPSLPGDSLLAQRGATLEERLRHVLEDLAARGFR